MNKSRKKNVLMIGPSRTTKGGMSTVVNNYFDNGLVDLINLKYIETINDKNIIFKFIKEKLGFIKFLINVKKYDIVHIHMASRRSTFRKIKYIKIAKKYEKKVVLHIHGGGFKRFYEEECNLKQQEYIKKYLKACDKIIVLSEEWAEYFKKIVPFEKIIVIYNGVLIPEDYKKNLDNKKILYLGRIEKEKGIYELLTAMNQLKKYNDIKLYIAGVGEEEKIKKILKNYGIEDKVELLGWVSDKKKQKYLKECSYFILPSYFEAMPMSLLEAMSYKCVVVATNVGGISQIIKNKRNGILIKARNFEAIVNSFEYLFNNENTKVLLSTEARETVKQKFDYNKNIYKVIKIYENL